MKKEWVSVQIASQAYEAVKKHVPRRAPSAQAYIRHWVEIGLLVDDLRAKDLDLDGLAQGIMDLIHLEGRRK